MDAEVRIRNGLEQDGGADPDSPGTGSAPGLVFITGPPAVGKMAVGHELAQRTGFRLFHNHMAVEPALRLFDFGTPAFRRIVQAVRMSVVEEVAASDLPGLVFTWVWDFESPEDAAAAEQYVTPFRERGGRVVFVELEATLEERLRRNRTEFRLREKASKRDVEASERRILASEARYTFNSGGSLDARDDWLRVETTNLTAAEAADRVIVHFGL